MINIKKRVFGFIAERLLNVYITHHKKRVKYLSVFNLDENNREFMLSKISSILNRNKNI